MGVSLNSRIKSFDNGQFAPEGPQIGDMQKQSRLRVFYIYFYAFLRRFYVFLRICYVSHFDPHNFYITNT